MKIFIVGAQKDSEDLKGLNDVLDAIAKEKEQGEKRQPLERKNESDKRADPSDSS